LGMPSAMLCIAGRRASLTAFPTGHWEREKLLLTYKLKTCKINFALLTP